MKAQEVVEKQQAIVKAADGVEEALRALVSLAPVVEDEATKQKSRAVSPDLMDSARSIARALKVIKLDALVIAQEIMQASDEAKEAAIKAQEGRFKIVEEPPAEPPAGPDLGAQG